MMRILLKLKRISRRKRKRAAGRRGKRAGGRRGGRKRGEINATTIADIQAYISRVLLKHARPTKKIWPTCRGRDSYIYLQESGSNLQESRNDLMNDRALDTSFMMRVSGCSTVACSDTFPMLEQEELLSIHLNFKLSICLQVQLTYRPKHSHQRFLLHTNRRSKL